MSKSVLYTPKFVNAIINGSKNAKINKIQTVCCSRPKGTNTACIFEGDLPSSFYIELKNKYDFCLAAIEIYDILLESNNKLINFLNFVVGITMEWELVAGSLKKTVLTSACLEGVPWRNGAILGDGPIPYFAEITSTYGDLILSFFCYLLRLNYDQSFNYGQIQEAYAQQRSECSLSQKYLDSDNFNPRKPFVYSPCNIDLLPERYKNEEISVACAKRLAAGRGGCAYPLSLIPQMVWLAFVIDIINFLDPKTTLTSEYRIKIRNGKQLMDKRLKIAEYCNKINELIIKKVGVEDIEKFSKSGRLLEILKSNKIIRKLLGQAGPLTDNLILTTLLAEVPDFLSDPTTSFLNAPGNKIKIAFELEKLLIIPNKPKLNDVILNKSIKLMDKIINSINTNTITDDLFTNICRFFNGITGLSKNEKLFSDVPGIADFKCNK
jgi:hypothetical protein